MTPEDLYTTAIDTDVTVVATSWLFKAYMLSEIVGENIDAAKQVINKPEGLDAANREYESLTEEQRAAVQTFVGLHWSRCVTDAVQRLWHACQVLDIDVESLDADHVALHAATLLSETEMVPPKPPDS